MPVCSECKQTKVWSEFFRNVAKRSGFHYVCRVCRSRLDKERGEAAKAAQKFGPLPAAGPKRAAEVRRRINVLRGGSQAKE